jgi:uncharacterized protein
LHSDETRWVVITGASEGIGRAIAERFAGLGRDVILVARSETAVREAASAIAARHRVRTLPLALDVTTLDAGAAIAVAARAGGGHVDVLVNNAGMGLSGPFVEADEADIERLLDLNVGAATRLTRHFLPGMRERRRGGVINVASLAGYTPGPWQAVYYASKAYLVSFSEAIAVEVAPDRVRVTAAVPGPIDTGFHDKMRAGTSYYRRLIPVPGPTMVAWATVAGWRLGLRVVVCDPLSIATFPFLRFMPHRLLIPIVGWLMRPR